MKSRYHAELLAIAKRIIWFKSSEESLKDPVYFLCYLMQYGILSDVITAKKFFSKNDFKTALERAYPGILDKKSWSYWNLCIFKDPNRPMPERKLD